MEAVITFINNTGKTSVNVMVRAQYCHHIGQKEKCIDTVQVRSVTTNQYRCVVLLKRGKSAINLPYSLDDAILETCSSICSCNLVVVV